MEFACVDHGLDGEAVSGFHHPDGFVFGVVRNGGCTVEQSVDAVSTVGAHH